MAAGAVFFCVILNWLSFCILLDHIKISDIDNPIIAVNSKSVNLHAFTQGIDIAGLLTPFPVTHGVTVFKIDFQHFRSVLSAGIMPRPLSVLLQNLRSVLQFAGKVVELAVNGIQQLRISCASDAFKVIAV